MVLKILQVVGQRFMAGSHFRKFYEETIPCRNKIGELLQSVASSRQHKN